MTRIPDTLVAVLGEPAGRDLTDWLEVIMDEGTVRRDEWAQAEMRFDKVESQLGSLDSRVGNLELRMERLEVRMEGVEGGLSELRIDVRDLRTAMDTRLDRLTAEMIQQYGELQRTIVGQTRWSVGVLALFATMVTVLLAINQLAR
jgi:hypothetical protein